MRSGENQQRSGPSIHGTTVILVKRDGKVVDRWTRTVQPDGQTMLITQHGVGPDGRPFRNNGVYRRVRSQ